MTTNFISYLLLSDLKSVDPKEYARRLAAKVAPVGLSAGLISEGDAGDAILIEVGPVTISILFVDQPVPPGTLDEAIAANRTWPDAGSALGRSRAHAIVACMSGAGDFASATHSAVALTFAASVLSDMLPTIGVYWSEGKTVTEASAFRSAADGIVQKRIPLETWIQCLWLDGPATADGQRTLAAVTTGLQPFVGREIEFMPQPLDPASIAKRVFGTIQYLLAHGPVLKDDDTLGVSEAERIRIKHARQGYHPGVPVLQLTVERLDKAPVVPAKAAKPTGAVGPRKPKPTFGKRVRGRAN